MPGWAEVRTGGDGMWSNPGIEWALADVEEFCRRHGIACRPPARGAHYVLSHPAVRGRLTIPARRPIKPAYIRLLVAMAEDLPPP